MKIFLLKQLTCLFAFLFVGILSVIATCSLSATIITSFPPDSFWEVDHTTPQYTYGGGRQYNPTGIIGYKYKPQNINLPNIENAYQLTDTIQAMTVALWHKQKLDLNQNWQFDFELFFDTGSARVNANIQVGKAARMIADGFCFVLNNKDTLENLIGRKQWEIGYGGISPSFAIEFDTEDNGYWEEGAAGQLLSSCAHISYLRDGNMQVIPGSLSQMQNGWGTVASSQWYKVRIVWRKVYENNTTYYNLSTYMEEKNVTGRPLLLRSSMRFNNLSEVITGLEIDSNCQALVNWGITSSTCNHSNRQMINFVKLETTEVSSFPAITAVITANCPKNPPISATYKNPAPQSNSEQSVPWPRYYHQDTILQPIDISDCYGISSQTPSLDTIEYTISCADADVPMNFSCNYFFWLHGIPDSAKCEYYLNDSLIRSDIQDTSVSGNAWQFLLNYKHYSDGAYAKVKIIIDSVEYNFKIFADDNTTKLAEQLMQLPNIQLDKDMHGGTLTLDYNTLTQSIKLPNDSINCRYDIGVGEYSPSSFVTLPTIDSNNVLTFELAPDVCSINLPIFLQCKCNGLFTLTVENSNCIEKTCDAITITTLSSIAGEYTSSDPLYVTPYGVDPIQNKITHSVKTSAGNHDSIARITVNEITTQTDKPFISPGRWSVHNNLRDTIWEVSITFVNHVCEGTITAYYEICTEFKNGTICCNTFSFDLACSKPRPKPDNDKDWIKLHYADKPGGDPIGYILLDEALFNSPIVPPLYVKVFDGSGTQLIATLHSSVPTSLTGSISYGHLPVGMYNIVFQWGDYIETIQVISSGTDR